MNKHFLIALTAVVTFTPGLSAFAQSSDTNENVLEEITVTAQRRDQALNDVSMSISALGAKQIRDEGITDVNDLVVGLPNVTVGNVLGMGQVTIRGLGHAIAILGADPAVAVHIDRAVISQPTAQLGSFMDLERIEVLRGPQGTLYGRNATGGVINLVSAKPTEELEGYTHGTFGNYNLLEVEGAISGPIVEGKLLGRFSYKSTDRDGYGMNELTGNDIDDAKRDSVRFQLLALPSDDVSIRLMGEWSVEDDNAYSGKFVQPLYTPEIIELYPNQQAAGAGGYAQDPRRNIAAQLDPLNDRETLGLQADINWVINDTWSLQSLTDYRESDVINLMDWDTGTNVTPLNYYGNPYAETFTQELQLAYNSDSVRGFVAAYFFKEDLLADTRVGPNPAESVSPALRDVLIQYLATVDTDSKAVFGNVEIDFHDDFTLVLGGRYTEETRSGDVRFTFGGTVPVSAPPVWADSRKDTKFDPKVTLEWRPTEDRMWYATRTEGFRSGMFNAASTNTPVLKPELVTNYEIGMTGTFFDNSLNMRLAAFHADYKDLQVGRTQPTASAVVVAVIYENAAAATAEGFEFEGTWLATDRLTFNGSLGYLSAKYDDFETASVLDLPDPPVLQRKGNFLRMSPEWTGSLGAHFATELSNGGTLSFHGYMRYRSEVFFEEANNPLLSEPNLTLWDGRISYDSPDGQLFVNLWTKNAQDEFYYASEFANATTRQDLGLPGSPRTYGVTVGYHF
ncbi:MAG: iron complex outermembrane receptor protein [Rhodothermales bacterium]|jgi:iron complex outermembrane receptor protein